MRTDVCDSFVWRFLEASKKMKAYIVCIYIYAHRRDRKPDIGANLTLRLTLG